MSRPTYLRIADDLRRRIRDGELTPGDRVPSRAQLSRQYRVSDRVAVEAVKVLMHEGLVQGRPGAGTFVRHRPTVIRRLDRAVAAVSPAAGLKGIGTGEPVCTQAPPLIAARLHIDAGTDVVRTDEVFVENDEPIMLATSWRPLTVADGTPTARSRGVGPPHDQPTVCVAAAGVTITRAVEAISARPALEAESHGLGLPRCSVVLVLCRTCLAEDRPVETTEFVVAADRHVVSYEFSMDT